MERYRRSSACSYQIYLFLRHYQLYPHYSNYHYPEYFSLITLFQLVFFLLMPSFYSLFLLPVFNPSYFDVELIGNCLTIKNRKCLLKRRRNLWIYYFSTVYESMPSVPISSSSAINSVSVNAQANMAVGVR